MCESEVQKFYNASSVFITGGTGFLGKILIEKLLRSTDVSTIYVLVREKKGKNMHSRLDELFDDIIFDRLKQECPKFKHKVVGIAGDCSIAGLGLTITDKEKVVANTNVIFHVAATVKFDENLKLAYSINVQSVGDVLDLARHMKGLKAVMHVSTAFSHCYLDEVEEKFYDCPDVEGIGKALEKLDQSEADSLTSSLLGKWPNTYTFTKALAESVIKNQGKGLPVGVYRPAIVISTNKEPIPAWIDNMYGPTGVCAGVATGVLRTLNCDQHKDADIVPVDTCVSGLIVAARDVHLKHTNPNKSPEDIPIYNYVSSTENPITWGEFNTLNYIHGVRYPLAKSVWTVSFRTTKSRFQYALQKIFLHFLPAVIFDIGFMASRRRPRLLNMYSKIHKFSDVLAYFCCREWKFTNKNVVNLWEELNETDKKLFPVSIKTVHWLSYFRQYIKGIRLYLMDDPLSSLEVAKRRKKRFDILQDIVLVLYYLLVSYVFYSLVNKVFSVIFNDV